jgi:hypothetical protein
MSNNKQTAVEWLVEKLQNRQNGIFKGIHYMSLDEIYNLAKEMEKQQIMEAFDYGDYCIDLPDGTWEQKYKSPEQYYNEEYGKR